MRRVPFFVGLLLAGSAVVAQDDGVMVLKSEQPYVSPFDKTPAGRTAPPASTLFSSPDNATSVPRGEQLEMEVQEVEKPAALVRPIQRSPAPARKVEPIRKKEEPRVIVKAEPIKPLSPKEEIKSVPAALDNKVEASVIPPKTAQNPKAELAPPPAAVAVRENGLTSFGKDSAAPTVSTSAPTLATAVVTPIVAVEAPQAMEAGPVIVVEHESSFPVWLLKAFLFFAIGGLLMMGGWYWIKRQALYGDPAFQDPWFRPVKGR